MTGSDEGRSPVTADELGSPGETVTANQNRLPRIATGVPNLDMVMDGGLPKASVTVVAGAPGSGKTILTQQICFQAAATGSRVLYFKAMSEPAAKTLRYLNQFSFFDAKLLDGTFQFVDLGGILRSAGLEQTASLIIDRIRALKPDLMVIDSFRALGDLAGSKEERRKFAYLLAVNLMAWEATALLVGEYGPMDYTTDPLFSVVDGFVLLTQREESGEKQRFLEVVKMRGTAHRGDEHAFVITSKGIEVLASDLTAKRESGIPLHEPRCQTGMEGLDKLLGEGIPRGSSLLVAGAAGAGKTLLLLEFVYRGALAGERGIILSFGQTDERLLATAEGMGWALRREIDRGMVGVISIARSDIGIEADLRMIGDKIVSFGAKRLSIDSLSTFLHRVKDAQVALEKVLRLARIVEDQSAVGMFASDIPYGSSQISPFGVEEAVVDGVIRLSSTEEGFERQRAVEVCKLRDTAHATGRHKFVIERGGIRVFPRN